MKKNKKTDTSVLTSLFLAGAGAITFSSTMPFLLPIGVVGIAGSIGFFAYDLVCDSNKDEMWRNIGIVTKDEKIPLLVNEIKTETGVQQVYHLPTGLSFEDVEKNQDKIENAFKKHVKLEKADNFNVIITTFDKKLSNLYKFKNEYLNNKLMQFVAGFSQSINGEQLETIDLNSSDCHILICGTTGSGKSELLRHLLTQFILQTQGNPQKGQIWVTDLKGGVTTKIFSRASNCIKYTVIPDECKKMMTELHEVMMTRYLQLNSTNCVDYKEYNQKFKSKPMIPIIFVIEEYSLIFNDKAATELMFLLLNLSRAANISVILTIQRPDFKTLDTRIKANLKTTVCFKVKYDVDSEIVLGHGNYQASRLLKDTPPGRGILNDEKHNDVVFQSLFMTTKEIEQTLQPYLTKKATISTYYDEEIKKPIEKPQKATKDDINKIDELI